MSIIVEDQLLSSQDESQADSFKNKVRDKGKVVWEQVQKLKGKNAQELLEEVRVFARERPVHFLAISFGVGFVIGRLLRPRRTNEDTGQHN